MGALYPEVVKSVAVDTVEVPGVDAQHDQILIVRTVTALDRGSRGDGAAERANQVANASKGRAGVHLHHPFALHHFFVQRSKYR